MADQVAAPRNDMLRSTGQLLAVWLGVLLPIATFAQMAYLSTAMSKLPQLVVAAIALIIVAMVTLSMWAAIGLWQGARDAADRVDRALLFGFAANVFCCAPLSILMSTPPYFLPIILVTLAGLTLVDQGDAVEQ